jgi:hypothetical protein
MAQKKKAARTRPIVTGYLEKVSSAIFDKYRKEITDMTMGQQGLYLFTARTSFTLSAWPAT